MSAPRPRRRISAVLNKKREAEQGTSGGRAEQETVGIGGTRMRNDEVDEAWRALLEEALPPDKQEALMETYKAESDPRARYNMLLEFSSYLRQSANGPTGADDEPDDKYRLKPRQQGRQARQGLNDDDDNLCWEITRVLLIVGAILFAVVR
jgi:hypothetical protein